MLTQIRKGASSWPAKILLGVIALSFVLWGMGGVFTDRNVNVVGRVGGVDIEIQRLQATYNQQARHFESQGFRIDQGSDLSQALARMAMDQLVQDALYQITAEELGVTIDDKTVRADIASNGLFQDDDGRFDGARFISLLRNNNLSEAGYVESLRRQIADAQLQKGIGATPYAPDAMVDLIYSYRFERRVAEIAVIPNGLLAPSVDPTESELETFFADHAERYRAPEYRSADYILIYPADLAAEMTATEEELHRFYDTNEGRWIDPERRRVERMVFATQEEAQAASDRVAAGEDFAAVAAEMGSDVLDLGTVTKADMFGGLSEPIFALEENAVSAPIASPLGGYLVARVTAIDAEVVVDFEAAREEVAWQLALEKAYDVMYDVANELDNMLAAGDSVAEAAATVGIPVRRVEAIDPDGNARDAGSLQIVPDAAEFLPELFAADQDFASPVIETDDNGLLALQVTAIEPARPLGFAEARDRVATDWRIERQADLARQAVDKTVGALTASSNLAEAFGDLAVTTTQPEPFRRSEVPAVEGVNLDIVAALFVAAPGDVVILPADDQEAQVVARLVSIEAADRTADGEDLVTLRNTLTSAIISDLGDQFRAKMRANHSVSIDQSMIEQYF